MKRPLLLPLVPLYAAVLGVKRRWFEQTPKRLEYPVISVGSLSAGGAGKTPVVAALATLLARDGYAVDVLSRGYGRVSGAVARVDLAGSAQNFGDEPLLLARRTGVPVYVGAERYEAGLLAERDAGDQNLIHLLDDGFQHRRLAREVDLVLLTLEDASDCLLPAGNLREPLARLRGADVVVLRAEEEAALRSVVMKIAGAEKPVWLIQRRLKVPHETARRPLAFCGIARAEGFFSMLRTEGIEPAGTVAFGDHHAYRKEDLERLIAEARETGADGFVTTEKDAVKISGEMRSRLGAIGPMTVAELEVAFEDEAAVLAQIRVLNGASAGEEGR